MNYGAAALVVGACVCGLPTSGNGAAVAPPLTSLGPARSTDDYDGTVLHKVVVNDGQRYAIWPADHAFALGWTDAGKTGTKAQCQAWIQEGSGPEESTC